MEAEAAVEVWAVVETGAEGTAVEALVVLEAGAIAEAVAVVETGHQ